jgi:uncharacterized protein (DUF2236 family)
VTLILTSVRAYEAWVRPLSGAEKQRFWGEARAVGVRLGISLELSPADWPSLLAYWDRMVGADGPIRVTPTARRMAPLIRRPPFPLVPSPLVDLAALPGLVFLPPRLKSEFGIEWGVHRERLARLLGTAIRAWVRVVPANLRAMPQARAAERRARGTRAPSPATRAVRRG